jgi:hypothetical protein
MNRVLMECILSYSLTNFIEVYVITISYVPKYLSLFNLFLY